MVLREVWRSRIWTVRPVLVVRDSPALLALYLPAGTVWKRPRRPDGGPIRLPAGDWTLMDHRQTIDVLRLNIPGAAHSVMLFWKEGHAEFIGWYVNLEEPLRRTAIGFDYMDQALDIVISPDMTEWHWKDEDELQEALAAGLFTPRQAAEIRREGERALELLLARRPPFDDGWERWRPDPSWPAPQLPDGWAGVAATAERTHGGA